MSTKESLGAVGIAEASGEPVAVPSNPHDERSSAAVDATVRGFTVGYWWAAGAFWACAVLSGALIRGGTRFHHETGQPEPLDEVVGGLI